MAIESNWVVGFTGREKFATVTHNCPSCHTRLFAVAPREGFKGIVPSAGCCNAGRLDQFPAEYHAHLNVPATFSPEADAKKAFDVQFVDAPAANDGVVYETADYSSERFRRRID
jgi:hypothetical protein